MVVFLIRGLLWLGSLFSVTRARVLVKGLLGHAVEGESCDGALQAWGDHSPWAVRTAPAREVFVFGPDHASCHRYTYSFVEFDGRMDFRRRGELQKMRRSRET